MKSKKEIEAIVESKMTELKMVDEDLGLVKFNSNETWTLCSKKTILSIEIGILREVLEI